MNDDVERPNADTDLNEILPDNVVGRLETIDLGDLDFFRRIREEKTRWVPVLNAAVEKGQLTNRALMNTGFLLLELGESGGTNALSAALDDQDEWFWRELLVTLSLRGVKLPGRDWQLPLDTELFAPVLLVRLEDSTDHLCELAVDIAGSYEVREVFPRLYQFLKHSEVLVRTKACTSLLLAGEHEPIVLDAASRSLNEHSSKAAEGIKAQHLIRALASVVEAGPSIAETRALEMLEEFVRANLGTKDNSMANDLWQATEVLAKRRGSDAIPLLETVYDSETLHWVRGIVLRHLAEIQGPESLPKVLESLLSEQMKEHAAKALVILVRRHGVAGPIDQLKEAAKGSSGRELGRIADVLMATETTEALSLLKSLESRLDPIGRMRVHWHLNNLGPRDVISRLESASAVPKLPEHAIEELVEKWRETPDAFGFLVAAFSAVGSVLWFDEEGGMPARHDKLVTRFGEASRGAFQAEAVHEKWKRRAGGASEGDYDVQFAHEGAVYKFNAKNYGKWYDVGAVVRAIHKALDDAGRQERFFRIHTGDQTALFLFAPVEGFESVQEELMIPVVPYDSSVKFFCALS